MGLASAGVAGKACGADVDGDAVKIAAAKKAVAKPHKDRANVVAWCPLLPLVLRAWAVFGPLVFKGVSRDPHACR